MQDFLNLTKTLSEKNRLKIIMALTNGKLCICQIRKMLGVIPSKVCKHLFVLESAGLIKCEIEEGWKYYILNDELDKPCIDIINWLKKYIPTDDSMGIDMKLIDEALNYCHEGYCEENIEEKTDYEIR
jgi:ArsR family transcriptional regulator